MQRAQSSEISVVIPVGPLPHHRRWLQEAIDSVSAQTVLPYALVIVDDMAGIEAGEFNFDALKEDVDLVVIYPTWRIGVSAAFNEGVIAGPTEYTLMLGSDDTLEPDAIHAVHDAIMREGNNAGRCYFSLPVRYMETGEVQFQPCNAAVVSKSLWRLNGGFPPEGGAGACDALLLSAMMGAKGEAGSIVSVADKPLYNVRTHADMDTRIRGPLQGGAIIEIRNWYTANWTKPEWATRRGIFEE